MTRLITFVSILLFAIQVNAQQYNPNINAALSTIGDPVQLVRKFESFGTKAAGSDAKRKTLEWIMYQYQLMGYDSIWVDSFDYQGATVRNLIVTKPGKSDSYLVVCGHYDTKNGPGANDNGSGVAAILEAARVVERLNTNRSIQFIHFDLEEAGFIGSDYHVRQYLRNTFDSSLYVVLNIDQIGGSKGKSGNDQITCERDEDNGITTNNARSWLITDTIAKLANIYTTLMPKIGNAFLSDYIPFEKEGYVITGLYQTATDVFGHSAADTLGNMDTISFKQAVRLTAASVIHFAQVDRFVGVKPALNRVFTMFPNPSNRTVHFLLADDAQQITLMDGLGRQLRTWEVQQNHTTIDVSDFKAGTYIVQVNYANQIAAVKKLIIDK